MPDEEEFCHHDIACSLRVLLREIEEITRLLQILVQENQSNSDLPAPAPKLSDNDIESLTDRENEVFQLLLTGISNRQIGRRLGIAERTVKNNLHSIYRKLGVSGRAEVISRHFGAPTRRDGFSG
ncbi:LuxR C-terminal-related transcriptional regulator [Streptomyces sp. SM11]|uniref:helix-turn-helix domain-containing protein n=1 Tax=Streptomyces sp. SM11 TaxID=565557 RepID=UPI0027E54D0D|nr:LuxR C-terminal-related transcriptional regulator [Streptomyces sp. SM11]